MATLTSQQLKDSYQSLVTIGDSITSDPTSGQLENGKGSPIDSVTIFNDATGVSDSSTLNLGVLSNDSNTNPRASIQAQKDGTNNGRLILNTSVSGTLTERMRLYSGGDISFRDGSANEAFYWDASTARLGIGTTDPDAKLDVFGSQVLQVTSSVGTSLLFNNNAVNQFASDKNYHLIDFNTSSQSSETTGGYVRIKAGQEVLGNDNRSYLSFWTAPNGGTVSEKMRIDSDGKVGIGVSPASILHAKGASAFLTIENTTAGSSASPNYSGILFVQSNGTSTGASIQSGDQLGSNSNNNLIFTTRASGGGSHTERLRILGEGGITFNGDTASANALDDYEEGTWSPVFAPQTGSFATMTMDIVSATYTKIGRQVTVNAFFRTDDVDVTGGSGDLRIGGLPFTVGSYSAVSVGYVRSWGTAPDGGYANPTTTNIGLQKSSGSANSSVSDLTTGATANQNQIVITATYFV